MTNKFDCPLMHASLQHESPDTYDLEYDVIYYDMGGLIQFRFGPKEFTCITGFTFGENVEPCGNGHVEFFLKNWFPRKEDSCWDFEDHIN